MINAHTDMLEKVRKLLTLAERATTDAEAQAFTAKASKLMAKYSITEALLEATAAKAPEPSDKTVKCPNPWGKVHAHLLQRLAREVGVQSIRLLGYKTVSVQLFGWDNDLERLEVLYTSVMLQMTTGSARLSFPSYYSASQVRTERRSWMLGYVSGVCTKVATAEREAVKEVVESSGTGAELVLSDRKQIVIDRYHEVHDPKSIRNVKMTYRGSMYGSGYRAGQNANIGGKPLTRGARALTAA